jgi:hypothetical protein
MKKLSFAEVLHFSKSVLLSVSINIELLNRPGTAQILGRDFREQSDQSEERGGASHHSMYPSGLGVLGLTRLFVRTGLVRRRQSLRY